MKELEGKTVLITGGTGSFGNAMIDRLVKENKKIRIIVYSRDEKKQHEMYLSRPGQNIDYIIGDVRDKGKLRKACRNVDFIFHAAALKHVSTGEEFPEEVINTNIIGTKNVIDIAEESEVKKVILLSSDKAVEPVNAYGMSKALAEKLAGSHTGDTSCVILRYGNVLGSRGSIVPILLDKIKEGKSLTITNENMTRFLLLIEEAVELALRCLLTGKHGELIVIKPPACTVKTLVESLELHFNKKFSKDIIGIRSGEKMHEAMLSAEEHARAITEIEKGITFARIPPLRNGRIDPYFYKGRKKAEQKETPDEKPFVSKDTKLYDAKQTLALMRKGKLL